MYVVQKKKKKERMRSDRNTESDVNLKGQSDFVHELKATEWNYSSKLQKEADNLYPQLRWSVFWHSVA